ncbi:PH domain-containing protein [Clostridium tarantellae]|uniref:PH domain-containing protein n=1 Tax=Clostridium tarantellae TaxID=39493 RepID=A0A6I1MLG6_9CLOT|nr:PH domain-containing protein [Clostridium tarantellae]MPQ43072.1 PH domain-containing protein [Clostridium tarantellae]
MYSFEESKRNHWTSIQKYIIEILTQIFFIFLVLLKNFGIIGLLIGVIIVLIIATLKWWKTIFYIKEDTIIYEKGILCKNKKTIPFNKITAINTEKNLVNRIFNTCTLKIDTGAATEKKAELILILNESLAEEFNKLLFNSKCKMIDSKEEHIGSNKNKIEVIDKYINVSLKEIVIYSLTTNKFAWILGIIAIWNKINDIISKSIMGKVNSKVNGVVMNAKDTILDNASWFIKIKYLILLIIIVYIIATIVSIVINFIKFNDFKLYKIKNKLNVEYGLITRKKYLLPIKKIQAVKLKQNIIQQFLGVYSIEVVIIGYGDSNDKKAIIYPIANKNIVKKIIKDFLPKFSFNGQIHNTSLKCFSKFIVKRCVFSMIFMFIILHFISFIPMVYKYSLIILLTLVQFILGCINYKNNFLGVSKNNVIASSGSIKKITYLIMQNNIQSITKEQNPLQRLINVCTYKIDICTNSFGQVVIVKHLKETIFNELEENLKF